jgi:anti-sigma factor RsiW
MHPRAATLVALADSELDPERSRRVRSHIEACDRCRSELARIYREKRCFEPAESPERPEVAQNLEAVMSAISRVQRLATRTGESAGTPGELRARICAQLQLYFGSGTVAAIGKSIPDEELVSRAQDLLSTFLGRSSASAILREILAGTAPVEAC